MASKVASKGKTRSSGKQVRTVVRAAAAPTSFKKTALQRSTTGKSAAAKTLSAKVKRASKTVAAPAGKKAMGALASWPQVKPVSGAVVTPSAGPESSARPQPSREAAQRASEPATAQSSATSLPAAASWLALAPWSQMSTAATRLMADDQLKAAMDRQLQLYQAMARFSPLHMSMQIMQGLLPARDAARRS